MAREPRPVSGQSSIGAGTRPADTLTGGSDTLAAGAADTILGAVPGTAGQAALDQDKPVVIGATETPIEPGGPGAGAAQLARRVEETVSRPLAGAEEVALGLRPLAGGDRAELERLRALEARGAFGTGVVVDASEVPGRRYAQAATTIKRDGVVYAPETENPLIPVDFAAYTELVSIGAIVADRWDELEPAVV